jgi:pimeloyl-ACP methyl ester carboxylesterase
MTNDFAEPQGLIHRRIPVRDMEFHVAEVGTGPAVLMIHGWPEFWATWLPLMNRLHRHVRLIAPDLRGFGDSSKSDGPRWDMNGDAHADDLAALIETMELEDLTVVGHDVGGYAAQSLARNHPAKVARLMLFNCPTPSVGDGWVRNGQVNEIWYQSFNQLELAERLVGASRETCRLYIGHFLRHWAHRKDAFEPVLEWWVDNFLKPGNLRGGFDWYRSQNAGRIATIDGKASMPPVIHHPTEVFWGRHDPILRSEWAAHVPKHFSNARVCFAEEAGHFVHVEMADEAAERIAAFVEAAPRG